MLYKGPASFFRFLGVMTSMLQVCYTAFWDEITLAAQEQEGHRVGEDGYIGKWRVVVVRNLPFMDQRLNGKIPKVAAELMIWCHFMQ